MADTTYDQYIANLQGLNDGLNSVANAATQYATYVQNQSNIDWQKEFATKNSDEAVRQYEKNFNEAVRQYEKNYAFNAAEMQRVQQNFENQHQISVADASKAGINPLALYGLNVSGSVSSPSSSVSATSGVGGSNNVNQNKPMSNPFVSTMANMLLGQKFEASENAKDRQTSKEIAELQEKTKQDEIMYNFLASSNSDATERLKIYKQEKIDNERLTLQRELGYLQNDIDLRNFSLSQYNSVVNLVQGNERIKQDWTKIQNQMQQFEVEQNMRKKELMWKNINSELDRFAGHIDTSLKCGTDIIKSALTVFGLKGVSIGR